MERASSPRLLELFPRKLPHNRTSINVQELIVKSALTGNTEAAYHALMLDPLAAAVCALNQLRALMDEMLAARRNGYRNFRSLACNYTSGQR